MRYSRPFWIIAASIGIISAWFAYVYFPVAFPIARIQVSMDRAHAVQKASELALTYSLQPTTYRQAATFNVDSDVQNYVELEAGGSAAFNEMITGTLYAPYTWTVRHFKENEIAQTYFYFKPDGTAYGFEQVVPELTSGAQLLKAAAQEIAEAGAQKWGVSLAEYALIESSQQVHPNRIDHTFVYERPLQLVGQGRFRLQLVVAGDRLSTLKHSVKIPESFSVRFTQMRSANQTLATAAQFAYLLLYIFLGCICGLYFLTRRRRTLFTPALIAAGIVSVLSVLSTCNSLPLEWMHYNTADARIVFLAQYLINALKGGATYFVLLALSFAAAEGLTRLAFPEHIQLWRVWGNRVANTPAITGRTIGGYILAFVDIAYVTGFYLITRTYLGWWMPSETFIDPNIIATYIPWLGSFSQALSAGFLEECLFRAVPLAGAALVGTYFGRRNLFIGIGFVMQILIFSAAHSHYPNFPSYARLVELLIPSTLFGIVYLLFGLLPAIIEHCIYDFVLMSLPIFTSTAQGAWKNQLIVIVLALIPLILVFRRRLVHIVPSNAYNNAWIPKVETDTQTHYELPTQTHTYSFIWYTVAGIALICWLVYGSFRSDIPGLTVSRNEAIALAQKTLAAHQVDIQELTPRIASELELEKKLRFVWQQPTIYRNMLGTYLPGYYWDVSFVRFTGPVEERIEKHELIISGTHVIRYTHTHAESAPGKIITKEQAIEKALAHISQVYGIPATQLKEISVIPTQLPARIDWQCTFCNTNINLADGQARIIVHIAGDVIADMYRTVHVPEQWANTDQSTHVILDTLHTTGSLLMNFLLLLIALYNFIMGYFNARVMLYTGIAYAAMLSIMQVNSFSTVIATFNTAEPFYHQVFSALLSILVSLIFSSSLFALLAGSNVLELPRYRRIRSTPLLGIAVGIIFLGIIASTNMFTLLKPHTGMYESAGAFLPACATIGQVILSYTKYTISLMTCILFINTYAHRLVLLTGSTLIACTFILSSYTCINTLPIWIYVSITLMVLVISSYVTIFRYMPSAVLFSCATVCIGYSIQEICYALYPGAVLGHIVGICCILYLTYATYTTLIKEQHD